MAKQVVTQIKIQVTGGQATPAPPVGTALGPTLGGALIGAFGWRAIFLVNLPLGLVALALAWRYLPTPRNAAKPQPIRFDPFGTLLLALTLAAYALAMTLGRDQFGLVNLGLLLAALVGLGVFLFTETKVAAPLIRLAMFRDPGLSAGCASQACSPRLLFRRSRRCPAIARSFGGALGERWHGSVRPRRRRPRRPRLFAGGRRHRPQGSRTIRSEREACGKI